MTSELPFPPTPNERLEKSASAFRTISEVALELAVPQHVLRFWETKFSQIRPLKRGGGRRYYRPEDIEVLRRVKALLYGEGYTIKGVQKLLRQSAQRGRLDGEVSAEGTVAAVREGGLAPERRRRLAAILDELVACRDLLRGGS